MRRSRVVTLIAVLLAGIGPVAIAQPASAATGVPAGYTRVYSPKISVLGHHSATGSVKCPGTTVPIGGGVIIATGDLKDNINSSYPSGRRWRVRVNIFGPDNTTFQVSAVCMKKPAGYQLISHTDPAPATSMSGGSPILCPGNKVPWGGGFSAINSGALNVNKSYPLNGDSWRVAMNNGGSDSSFTTYAMCANEPRLFRIAEVSGTSNPNSEDPSRSGGITARCGVGETVVAGGVLSHGFQNVNTSIARNNAWVALFNNGPGRAPFTIQAICVGT